MTTETALRLSLDLDGRGHAHVRTGVGFLDHLLTLAVFHAGFDLELVAGGDLDVDDHHLVEDVLAAFGTALADALGDRGGIARYGSATVPMDEARATAAVDLVRRPHAEVSLRFDGDRVGGLALSLLPARARAPGHGRRFHHARRVRGSGRPPRRGGGLQGARACAARGLRARRRRRAVDEGALVKVVLCDYGAGNLRSVGAAFGRAGAAPVVSTDPAEVLEAPLAVIAGVGHVESAARGLQPVAGALRERVAQGRPTFGICVGMQLLFEESEEGGRGLGLLEGPVRRLRARRVPHMGWNTLSLRRPSLALEGLEGADVYFAHSYAAEPANGVAVAVVEHDGEVVAAIERGALAGVQFHPERSGAAGARLLENVLRWSRSA